MTTAVSSAAPTAGAARAGAARTAEPIGSGWFIPVAGAPRALPASRRRRLRSAGRGNLLYKIQCHLGIDMPVGMDRIARPSSPHGLHLLLHVAVLPADQLDPVQDRRRRQCATDAWNMQLNTHASLLCIKCITILIYLLRT